MRTGKYCSRSKQWLSLRGWCDDRRQYFSADQKNSYCCIYCQRVEVEKKPFHFPVASLYNGFTLQ